MEQKYDPMSGVAADFYNVRKVNLLDRWQPVTDWFNARLEHGVDPYCRTSAEPIATRLTSMTRDGRTYKGCNFASQDYLGLASHPAVLSAAKQAIDTYGVHSAGSAALMGLSKPLLALEASLANFLELKNVTVFPTGWGAGYGTIRTLAKPGDHIMLDILSHACLQEAAEASGAKLHRFSHCNSDAVAARLKRVRANEPSAGILLVTEGVFSMDSDSPDISTLQALADEYQATLFVDVAHDLGALGKTGRGMLEMQGVLGKVDVVMGSFSKSFAANGGFVATNHPALKLALRSSCGPSTFSNAMTPVTAATIQACLNIISSDEGAVLRRRLMDNSLHLRNGFADAGFHVMGQPSPIVPVVLGTPAFSRCMTRDVMASGAIVNLVEHPAVARNACRLRLQIMATHERSQIDDLIGIATSVRDQFNGTQRSNPRIALAR